MISAPRGSIRGRPRFGIRDKPRFDSEDNLGLEGRRLMPTDCLGSRRRRRPVPLQAWVIPRGLPERKLVFVDRALTKTNLIAMLTLSRLRPFARL
jgi:hypothetical protein